MKPAVRKRDAMQTTTQVASVEGTLEASTPREREIARAYQDWYRPAIAYATTILEDRNLARDVVGDVFLGFIANWEGTPLEHKTLWYFLHKVNQRSIDVLRRLNKEVELNEDTELELGVFADEPPLPDFDPATGEIDAPPIIARAIKKLPKHTRAAWHLIRRQGLNRSQVASVLGCTPKTVSNLMLKADRYIRASLNRAGIVLTDGLIRRLLPPSAGGTNE